MKILVVSSYFDTHPGGLETIAGKLSVELCEAGHQIKWMATDATAPRQSSVEAVALRSWNAVERRLGLPLPVLTPAAIAKLHKAVKESDLVFVHDTLYMTSICAFLSAKACGKPLLILQHLGGALFSNPLVQRLARLGDLLVSRPMLASADQVVFISQTVADHFGSVRLRRPAPISFTGVDGAVFRPPIDADERARLRAHFQLPDGRPVVLYVGRFVSTKGLSLLMRLARLRPDLEIVLAGWGPVDPDGWGLANMRALRGLAGDTLADLYRSADIFVLPSPSESFSLVVREALACGLPVVCSDATASTDPLIRPHVITLPIGLDAGDETALRLAQCVDLGLGLQDGAGSRVAFVRSRYAWSRVAKTYVELIERLDPTAVEGGLVKA